MKFFFAFLLLASQVSFAQNTDVYRTIYNSVDQNSLIATLKNLGGVTPVTVKGKTFSISERYTPQGKANFRAYFTDYFSSLGMNVKELTYQSKHTELDKTGYNLEAVLPGKSPDSIIIIVHYDSIGENNKEAENPGVDDDMSGMTVSFETAKILSQYKDKLQHTVRFVAADFEEWGMPGLEGARQYMKYITALAKKENFKLVAGIDNEQIGWSGASPNKYTFSVFSCGGETESTFLGDQLAQTALNFAGMVAIRDCIGPNSDHYAVWESGIPAVVYSEAYPFQNPHFDSRGGDYFERIDQDYFARIARVGVVFAAQVVGVDQ